MRWKRWGGLLFGAASVLALAGRALPTPPKIQDGAEQWVIAQDLGPFVFTGASARNGERGEDGQYFGSHPDNVLSGADYEDVLRHMSIGVGVSREARTHYLQYFIEAPYRDNDTGRFSEGISVATVSGQPVLLWCAEPPDCTARVYTWRSGTNIVVSVSAGRRDLTYTPGSGRAPNFPPCPEPTEILTAYLERYPSSLEQQIDIPLVSWLTDAVRAHEHVKTEVALELAAARYWIAMAERKGVEHLTKSDLRKIAFHLQEFATLRARLMSGAPGRAYEKRLTRLRPRPAAERLAGMKKMEAEFSTWWLLHHPTTPIHVPELPPEPPPALPTTPPPSPLVTPTAAATP